MRTAKRILMVDDDRDFVEAVASFLEGNGFAVTRAHGRTEGFFTIHQIRREPELKDVPIFVLSSFCTRLPDLEVPVSGGWLAHDMFFAKPVDVVELLAKIRERTGQAA